MICQIEISVTVATIDVLLARVVASRLSLSCEIYYRSVVSDASHDAGKSGTDASADPPIRRRLSGGMSATGAKRTLASGSFWPVGTSVGVGLWPIAAVGGRAQRTGWDGSQVTKRLNGPPLPQGIGTPRNELTVSAGNHGPVGSLASNLQPHRNRRLPVTRRGLHRRAL